MLFQAEKWRFFKMARREDISICMEKITGVFIWIPRISLVEGYYSIAE